MRGFRTGDIVRATVPSGKKRGVHVGRVAVRRTGSFNVQTAKGDGAGDLAPALPASSSAATATDITSTGHG